MPRGPGLRPGDWSGGGESVLREEVRRAVQRDGGGRGGHDHRAGRRRPHRHLLQEAAQCRQEGSQQQVGLIYLVLL